MRSAFHSNRRRIRTSANPADVFRPVVRQAAVAVLFAHNHPSGETVPSEEDAQVTQRLLRAGQLLGVQVLDHLIIGHEGYFSFLDAGLLPGDAAASFA